QLTQHVTDTVLPISGRQQALGREGDGLEDGVTLAQLLFGLFELGDVDEARDHARDLVVRPHQRYGVDLDPAPLTVRSWHRELEIADRPALGDRSGKRPILDDDWRAVLAEPRL